MAMKRFGLLALVLLALPACHGTPLFNPAPFKGLSTADKTQEVIRAALLARGWRIAKEEPGAIHATYARRAHVARILIDYKSDVTIKYVGSENLKHDFDDNGTEVIHRRYNKWINTLLSDINRKMLLAAD